MSIYLILKLVHVTAVILFLGNIYTGLFWMSLAVKKRDREIITHTISGIIESDKWFTIPGVIIITAGGILSAAEGGIPLLRTGWIFWSIFLFSISGIAFALKVAPLQKKIYKHISASASAGEKIFWDQFDKLNREWEKWGAVALVTPILALMMMVLKFPVATVFF